MFTIKSLEEDRDYASGYNKKWIGVADDGGEVEVYWMYIHGKIRVFLDNQRVGEVSGIAGDIDEAKMLRIIKRSNIAQMKEDASG